MLEQRPHWAHFHATTMTPDWLLQGERTKHLQGHVLADSYANEGPQYRRVSNGIFVLAIIALNTTIICTYSFGFEFYCSDEPDNLHLPP